MTWHAAAAATLSWFCPHCPGPPLLLTPPSWSPWPHVPHTPLPSQHDLPLEDSAPIVDGLERRLANARAEAAAAASRILLATIRVNVDGELIPLSIYNGVCMCVAGWEGAYMV